MFNYLLLISVIAFSQAGFAIEQKENYFKFKSGSHLVFDTVPLNLEEITNSANRVFTGVCTKIEEIEKDPVSKLNVVKYTFRITENIKGTENKNKITFKQWKPTAKEAGYETGKKYVLFLYPDSNIGLTSPVGFLQGKFLVEKIGKKRKFEFIRNKINNNGLSRNFRTKKRILIKSDQKLNKYIHECSELGKPIRYKDFIKAVRYFAEK